jgi:acetoin utilization deacetylase AcuC-like enzyme
LAFLAYDELFLEHDTGPGHPESAHRLRAILSHLDESGLASRLVDLPPRAATREEIELAHDAGHYERVESFSRDARPFDLDTPTGHRSFEAARRAAGSTLAAADEVMSGGQTRGLCLVRPPGHHATSGRAMGFCLFNNLAVCARYLMREHAVSRVAIVDFDVHHGNGTEAIFARDPAVFYLSLHRYPFYPGTGGPYADTEGLVAVRNVPLPGSLPPEEYHRFFDRAAEEVEAHAPEVVLVSAGFDSHVEDPIGGLNLETADFGRITGRIVELAERCADGRIISALEGGYSLRRLGECVAEHLRALDPSLAEG